MKKISTSKAGLALLFFSFFTFQIQAQNLPDQMHFSADGKRLISGGLPSEGVFDEAVVNVFELWFSQSNYWTLLTNNYQGGTDLPATLIINGDTLESPVGVRFRGQTSYQMTQNSQKKSFNLTLNYEDEKQDYDGYNTFNLNNCFEDPSFMREVFFEHEIRKHVPAVQGSYVHLFINGQSWGVYPNIQQLDGDFFKQWYLSNDGTIWRALKTIGGGGGPGGGGTGGPFGTGYCTLNWLDTSDSTEYKKYYTLKRTQKTNPWEDLINVIDKLNNTSLAQLEDSLRLLLDLDRTLWFLAAENVFGDDDSYINKGGMDYYLYWEPETGRLVPQEYDANSVMWLEHATWSPFYHETDARYVLMNRLFAVPNLRQRYLAHLRT
ncbi:MAG: CotH kinase family protein, partial [Bacteroidota bacterium]